MEDTSASARGGGFRVLRRIRESLENPQLVGSDGYQKRYSRVQWWVLIWRLLILLQIPEVALVRPDLLGPLPYAFTLGAVALIYAVIHHHLATRTRAAGTLRLQAIDIAACAALMLLAREPKLLFIMSFYSYSSLLARPTTRLRIIGPAMIALSAAFVAADATLGLSPTQIFHLPREVDNLALYFFFGLGFMGFSGVLSRVSALELESILEEQRQDYRRRLHDDLGNTLCGLHFKIQSLKRARVGGDIRPALAFLTSGYERAARVLKRLVTGIDAPEHDDFACSLRTLASELEESTAFQVTVRIEPQVHNLALSPGVQREAVAIAREAATNAIKHSGGGAVKIAAEIQGDRFLLSVRDDGRGFSPEALAERQAAGCLGIRGMNERAQLLRGQLYIGSDSGCGTSVSLELDAQRAGVMGQMLDYDPKRTGGGLYLMLVRLRAFMYVWTIVRLFLLTDGIDVGLPLIAAAVILGADAFKYVLFPSRMFTLLSARPWLLLTEEVALACLIYLFLQSGDIFFFPLYLGVVVMMNGLFLDTLKSMALTFYLDLGILAAYAMAPAGSEVVIRGLRFEEPLQHMTIYMILAFSAGVASEFVRSLEGLQVGAIRGALARQREQLSADTHRHLQQLVDTIGREIRGFQPADGGPGGEFDINTINRLESSSAGLKVGLRRMLKSLDEPDQELPVMETA